ncbi:hypothetical protein TIFTF001_029065 [Ficus carica]|uniref:Uncharacterized protein n=1 Tax=Ficus carica TaxID=3494 RepID=A0AA88DR46_FICCA|nr:hypothetical protein TIFTF001_029065 [Ficus carica]
MNFSSDVTAVSMALSIFFFLLQPITSLFLNIATPIIVSVDAKKGECHVPLRSGDRGHKYGLVLVQVDDMARTVWGRLRRSCLYPVDILKDAKQQLLAVALCLENKTAYQDMIGVGVQLHWGMFSLRSAHLRKGWNGRRRLARKNSADRVTWLGGGRDGSVITDLSIGVPLADTLLVSPLLRGTGPPLGECHIPLRSSDGGHKYGFNGYMLVLSFWYPSRLGRFSKNFPSLEVVRWTCSGGPWILECNDPIT